MNAVEVPKDEFFTECDPAHETFLKDEDTMLIGERMHHIFLSPFDLSC